MERRVDHEKAWNHFLQCQQRCARLQLLFPVSLILVKHVEGWDGVGVGEITPLREGHTLHPHALGSGDILCGVCTIFLRLHGFSPGFLPQPKHLHSRPVGNLDSSTYTRLSTNCLLCVATCPGLSPALTPRHLGIGSSTLQCNIKLQYTVYIV